MKPSYKVTSLINRKKMQRRAFLLANGFKWGIETEKQINPPPQKRYVYLISQIGNFVNHLLIEDAWFRLRFQMFKEDTESGVATTYIYIYDT